MEVTSSYDELWISYPLLLNTLNSAAERRAVDKVAESRRCGRFAEARQIYEEHLLNKLDEPVVVFELADWLDDQQDQGQRLDLLERSSLPNDAEVQILLGLMKASAELWVHGKLEAAIACARGTKIWLTNYSIAGLTDVQLRCVLLYYQIIDIAEENSNWVNPHERTVFEHFGADRSRECAVIAEKGRVEGRLYHAVEFAIRSMIGAMGSDAIAVAASLVEALGSEVEFRGTPALLIALSIMRLVAWETARAQEISGERHLSAAMKILESVGSKVGVEWQKFAPRIAAWLEIDRLTNLNEPLRQKCFQLRSYAGKLRSSRYFTECERALQHSIQLALAWDAEVVTSESSTLIRDLQAMRFDLHRKGTKISYLVGLALVQLCGNLSINQQIRADETIMEECQNFKAQNPEFDIPRVLELICFYGKRAAGALGSTEHANRFQRDYFKVLVSCPFVVKQNDGDQSIQTGSDTSNPHHWFREVQDNSMSDEAAAAAAMEARRRWASDEPQHWSPNAVRQILDNNARAAAAIGTCLQWTEQELQDGELGFAEWNDIFGRSMTLLGNSLPGNDDRAGGLALIQTLQVDEITQALISLRRQDWIVFFNSLRRWLERRPRKCPGSFYLARLSVLHGVARAWEVKEGLRIATSGQVRSEQEIKDWAEDKELAHDIEDLSMEQPPTNPVRVIQRIRMKIERVQRLATVPNAAKLGIVTLAMIEDAITHCDEVIMLCSSSSNDFSAFTTHQSKADIQFLKFVLFGQSPWKSITASLESLLEAERIYNEVRRQRSVGVQRNSLRRKATVQDVYDARSLYDFAILRSRVLYTTLGNMAMARTHRYSTAECSSRDTVGNEAEQPQQEQRNPEYDGVQAYSIYLSWVHKSKSRVLLDALGLASQISLQSKLIPYGVDDAAVELVHMEAELTAVLARTAFPESLRSREVLEQLRSNMRLVPSLRDFMRNQDGDTISLDHLMPMLQTLPDNVVLIDFVAVNIDEKQPLAAVAIRKMKLYYPIRITGISLQDIREWANANLRGNYPLNNLSVSSEALAELRPLLEPLVKKVPGGPNLNDPPCIRPGDTIVFCLTDILHRIPLHAIPLDGSVPLLEGHMVVYCQSLSLVYRGWEKVVASASAMETGSDTDTGSMPSFKSVVLNPMPACEFGSTKTATATALSCNANAVKALATRLGVGVNDYHAGWEGELTRDKVLRCLSDASVVHYHGHVYFDAGDAMESFLCLDEAAFVTIDQVRPHGERLSANDIASGCQLAAPALATLIGCRSGASVPTAANDALGLTASLHLAGASAVVSTMWKVDDDDGAEFATLFYNELLRQSQEHEKRRLESRSSQSAAPSSSSGLDTQPIVFLDLAKAMQIATKAMRFDSDGRERSPYHWAGFVLNGFWWFPNFMKCLAKGD